MNILDARTVWIDNRCYRLLPIRDSTKNYEEEDYEPITSQSIEEDAIEVPGIPIDHIGDRFVAYIHIPGPIIKHVKGAKGKMIKTLERNGSKVNFPDRGANEEHTIATISGSTKGIVASTCIQINNIIINQRFREDYTHFISLPMNSLDIQMSFMKFKSEILSKYKKARGISESIFQDPKKLHVTVAMLVLLDDRDKEHAEAILKRCIENIKEDFGERRFTVNVKGVEYMNDDPSEVDVLYAKLHEEDNDTSLQVAVDKIMKEFVGENLAKNQYEKVKLHVTLMNTRFRPSGEIGVDEQPAEERITFDARHILRDYNQYEFGLMTISEVHISVRYTSGPDGFYMASRKVKL